MPGHVKLRVSGRALWSLPGRYRFDSCPHQCSVRLQIFVPVCDVCPVIALLGPWKEAGRDVVFSYLGAKVCNLCSMPSILTCGREQAEVCPLFLVLGFVICAVIPEFELWKVAGGSVVLFPFGARLCGMSSESTV